MKYSIIGFVVFVIIACRSYKPVIPTNNHLNAIKPTYNDVTLDKLNKGYKIYTEECVKCHNPKKISNYREEKWPEIISVMSKKAKINEEQKDAVLKYVLSVKASESSKTM